MGDRRFGEFQEDFAARGILERDGRFVQVELDLSNKCNIRCRMCYFSRDEFFYDSPVYFTPDRFDALAEEVFPYTHTLALSLGSEPLTSPHFRRILGSLKRWGIPNTTFYTNALLLNAETADAVIEAGITQVCISIDGATKETYEHIRAGADFDRFLRNVRGLVALRESRQLACPSLRFSAVMMRRNVRELEAMVSLASDLGVAEVNFFHLVRYEGVEMDGESLAETPALSNYWLARALERAAELGVRVAGAPRPFGEAREDGGGDRDPFAATPYCRYPFFHLSINAGGHVLACPFSHGVAPFGRVGYGSSLADVWFGQAFTELRERILNHDPPDMCRRCSYLATHFPDAAGLFATRRLKPDAAS